jgi:predicted O-methyltransferase YrrM
MTADPAKIDRLNHALYPSLAMLAGMQLDVFSPLADGPMTTVELAAKLGVGAAKLDPLLHALVIAELLEQRDGGGFANSPEADHFFVKGRPDYRGGGHELFAYNWPATMQTAETIRIGAPQAKVDFATMDDEGLGGFFRGLHNGAVATGRNLLASELDLRGCRRLLDVGGGTGGTAIALCEALPEMTATVFELPRIANVVTRQFVSEAGLADRIAVLEGDAVTDTPPRDYDLIVMKAMLQVIGPADAGAMVANVAKALAPGGRLIIIGRVLNDDRISPSNNVFFNLLLLNIYDNGVAHTEGEHRQWITEAGLTDVQMLPWGTDTLVAATRPA